MEDINLQPFALNELFFLFLLLQHGDVFKALFCVNAHNRLEVLFPALFFWSPFSEKGGGGTKVPIFSSLMLL